jgi:FAD/FMN-containing dehydrogenase
MASYLQTQGDRPGIWAISQKQTGADDLTIGGTLSANAHGRSLRLPPIIHGVESFELVDSLGETRLWSRSNNPELFSLAIGGYGLFGVISKATLRLARRQKVRRAVDILRTAEAIPKLEQSAEQGALYGDYQFCIDETSPDFLQFGVCSCYHSVADETPMPATQGLNQEGWLRLLKLAYTDRRRAFEEYVSFYKSTHDQVYWSDGHQFGPYLPNYAKELRDMTPEPSSLMITELYVPRFLLADFLEAAARVLRLSHSPLIYGTVRLIQSDQESFLPWARQDYACVIFNLLVAHDPAGIDSATRTFRGLIDLAIERGGSYYLTYHRYATARQLEACYPQFRRFLQLKKHYDPDEFFQSDWYRHYRNLLAGG